MRAQRTDARSEELLDPTGAVWQRVAADEVALTPTPIEQQPSEYVRVAWKERPYGLLPRVQVQALHNGDKIFFRLSWEDASQDDRIADTNQFTDAAAVLFPIAPDAPVAGMGLPGKPVNAWLWRPDWPVPKNVSVEGVGSTQRRDDASLAGGARHQDSRWQVVISRTFALNGSPKGSIALAPGAASRVAFAVWQGANQERAGVKAYSPDWIDVQIDA